MSVEQSVEWSEGETEVLRENVLSAALSATNPIHDPGLIPGRRCGNLVTNGLSCDMISDFTFRYSSVGLEWNQVRCYCDYLLANCTSHG
jgi:hypothetical protein